jgi:hypothetical protein
VYFNASKNQAIVIHRGSDSTISDWSNNLAFVTGPNKLTGRYKDAERVQKRAEEKYADVLTTGHSQGGIYTQIARAKNKIIDINQASFLQKSEGTTIRSKNDPVSALRGIANIFSPSKKNITTEAKVNPLEAHSINILDDLQQDQELGGRLTIHLLNGGSVSSRFSQGHYRVD